MAYGRKIRPYCRKNPDSEYRKSIRFLNKSTIIFSGCRETKGFMRWHQACALILYGYFRLERRGYEIKTNGIGTVSGGGCDGSECRTGMVTE
jgi:hypothetical protein